jgi:hypothetical protein
VNFEGVLSFPEKITHGVPQGSILGPLLFIILINDMQCQLVKCSMLMYADDTVLFFSSKNILEIENIMNSEAEQILAWINENCLILNKKKGKTEFILYRAKSNNKNCNIKVGYDIINQPQSYEYLGVTLDSHLNLNEHYTKVSKRINTRIKLLKKIRHEIPPYVAEQIYNSIIKPIFLYCSTVNLGQSHTWSNRFEKLQNQAKIVIGRNASNWSSIEVERKRKIALEVYKNIHGLNKIKSATYDIIDHSINTRGNKSTIRLPKIRTETARKISHYQGAIIYNMLPANARNELCFSNFKRFIKNYHF